MEWSNVVSLIIGLVLSSGIIFSWSGFKSKDRKKNEQNDDEPQ